jgi:hypothetical protein
VLAARAKRERRENFILTDFSTFLISYKDERIGEEWEIILDWFMK